MICICTSFSARSIISSMRAGCIRPSTTSLSKERRATSRRTGSKLLSVTASGVSSTIKSTPVSVSNVLIFRPSRPMIRPFISSDGRLTTLTTTSDVNSTLQRCIAVAMISCALRSASRLARSSNSLSLRPIRWLASDSTLTSSMFFASSLVN